MTKNAIRNLLAALIGLWFVGAPWIFGFSGHSGAQWSMMAAGFIEFAFSLLALDKTGWDSWQHWIAFLAGVWFMMLPFIFSFGLGMTLFILALGIVTVLLNFYNMNAES
ncbi:SPW repeat-containing protein [Paenibacillus tianmuensis]|uniref:SPW repeat-containing protein n=1 Tax=Paenibacillus tianmuensis TaxID=624147 RepID=A0A1G4Q2J0_9BACL|nr:SPW repeat protein [Paenibacillus tianmuensis]SCW38844.1 SPW repeat-containing protein [Paenibacillus tianmuensis]